MDTGKVDAKQRRVFKNDKGRTHVVQSGKKVYVKKMFTPKASPATLTPKSTDWCAKWRLTPLVNPVTGRKIKQGGPVYVKLEKKCTSREIPKEVKQVVSEIPKETKRVALEISKDAKQIVKLPDKLGCASRGVGQRSSTCWFNSALNGFVLGSMTSNILLQDIKRLDPEQLKDVRKATHTDTCPLSLTRKYVYSYLLKLHENKYRPLIQNEGVKFLKRNFTPGKLPEKVTKGKIGYFPMKAIEQLLSRCFGPESFKTMEMIDFRKASDADGKRFVVCSEVYTIWLAKPSVENYKLSHMVYAIKTTTGGYHASVAFVCDGERYLYDSNKEDVLKLDWTNKKNRDALMNYSTVGSVKPKELFGVQYALYVKE
jgi:hypothetical protein